jgi:NADPH-dependent glutamate synthase beta subunit-like oxidoreductase|tara:strand:- start:4033 stop:5364 length:1332 start_codon:yes stop_codon:yes gene_type:complete
MSKNNSPLQVVVIGAGPSGFYTADALMEVVPNCCVDIIEALPTPYGLIRSGVAPDHQNTKAVSRVFARTAQDSRFGYYGNVVLGKDVSLDELHERYDAIILATGAPLDRPLGIPGSDAAGVYGSAAFVGWYNGHPSFKDLNPNLSETTTAAVIIGNGNVAIDVARVLIKTPHEMINSDLATHAAKIIHSSSIKDVYIIGRRSPLEAKFSNKELVEMGQLTAAIPVVDPAQIPAKIYGVMSDLDRHIREKNLATLRNFSGFLSTNKRKSVHFLFNSRPVKVFSNGCVTGVRLERTRVESIDASGTGEMFEIPCGLVISAIGYQMPPLTGVPMDASSGVVANLNGYVSKGLYVVGWAKRGPKGVIGTNKADAEIVADQILKHISAGFLAGRVGLETLLTRRKVNWVSFSDWQKIEASEVSTAPAGAPRKKITKISDMLAIVKNKF